MFLLPLSPPHGVSCPLPSLYRAIPCCLDDAMAMSWGGVVICCYPRCFVTLIWFISRAPCVVLLSALGEGDIGGGGNSRAPWRSLGKDDTGGGNRRRSTVGSETGQEVGRLDKKTKTYIVYEYSGLARPPLLVCAPSMMYDSCKDKQNTKHTSLEFERSVERVSDRARFVQTVAPCSCLLCRKRVVLVLRALLFLDFWKRRAYRFFYHSVLQEIYWYY